MSRVQPRIARIARIVTAAVGLAAAAGAAEERTLRPVIGESEKVLVEDGDTLLDVAYRHRLGFQALVRLNPGVDPWIPIPGTVVLLPTRLVLPEADEEGLVVNIPEMRLFDFGVEDGPEVYALAVGDQADPSILGDFRAGAKRRNPTWTVPASIRSEKPELPPTVPPGPDNPLGSRWITIGNTSYGIHGTNVRWSIGREATHGCLRLYEDAIQRLFDRVDEGTRIQIVYQPVKWGRDGVRLVLEAHPDLYGLQPDRLSAALELPAALDLLDALDLDLVRRTLDEARGIPVPVGMLPPPTSTPTSRTSRPRGGPHRRRSGRPPGLRWRRDAPSPRLRRRATRRCRPGSRARPRAPRAR